MMATTRTKGSFVRINQTAFGNSTDPRDQALRGQVVEVLNVETDGRVEAWNWKQICPVFLTTDEIDPLEPQEERIQRIKAFVQAALDDLDPRDASVEISINWLNEALQV